MQGIGWLAGVLGLTVALAGDVAAAGPGATGGPRAGGRLPAAPAGLTFRTAAQAMGGSWTDEQVRRYASLFDLVIVGGSADRRRVALYHHERPGIQVLAYTGAFDVHNSSPVWNWIKREHHDWFLLAEDGGHIRTFRDANRYALNAGIPGVRAYFADSARHRIAELGADGVWEDNVFPDWKYRNLAGNEPLAAYTSVEEWRAALEGYLTELEHAVYPHVLAVNQVVPWTRHGDIVVIEEFPRSGAAWSEMLAGFAKVGDQAGRTTMLLQHLDGPDDPSRAFVTASYLMAANPGAYLGFRWDGPRESIRAVPEYQLRLGAPHGPAVRANGGLWWRDWDRARVAVNPTDGTLEWPGGGSLGPHQAGIQWRPGADRVALPDWVELPGGD